MKPTISSHPDNDSHRHYEFARRSDPQYYAPRGLHPDAVVMVIALFIALLTLFGVWWTEGGL